MDFIPDYINKVITNLVANAIKFTPENGRIYITADVEGDNLRLCVADNGCGIARNEIPHIFDIFYQGENGKLEAGSGIGLSLVRQLVEAMNGSIVIKSAENEGSVFIITLPIKQGSGEWEKISTDSISAQLLHDDGDKPLLIEATEIDETKPVILVVEDNNDILSYIGNIIKDAHIQYAHNGKEGIEVALDIIPDIIVTDIMMPGMNGLEMCRQIRQSEILNHIPIIAITAKSTEKDKIEGIKAGINAYIYKPFNADELNATINTTLELRQRVQENFARNHSNGDAADSDNNMSKTNQAFINKVIDIIYTQMAHQNVNPSDIATALCMCTKQLSRKINAITGESMSKYILQVRMNRAKKLMDSNEGYSIAEVAQRCGYEETSNFSRAFKQVYGITPSQYNKQP
jgi:DNA-binding response OmpR family regulator/anti-sigma regulatory factor (Ser/Thr protein kinase)